MEHPSQAALSATDGPPRGYLPKSPGTCALEHGLQDRDSNRQMDKSSTVDRHAYFFDYVQDPGSTRLGGSPKIFRFHVNRDHKTAGSFVFESIRTDFERFDFIRHQQETVITRRGPVFDILQNHRLRSHSRKSLQFYLR